MITIGDAIRAIQENGFEKGAVIDVLETMSFGNKIGLTIEEFVKIVLKCERTRQYREIQKTINPRLH